jgi:N-methylhydantoinase A/oxoprolinase/acetone carboxylase beta subunit
MRAQSRVLYECQFERQSHTLHVLAPLGVTADELKERFITEYRLHFGQLLPTSPIVLRSARIETRCKRRGAESWSLRDAVAPQELTPPAEAKYWRPNLVENDVIDGPATISAVDASIVLPAKSQARVTQAGHIIIEVES